MKWIPALACAFLLTVEPGCNALLYPFARAFGGPSEAELKQCRPSFDRMKAGFATARFVVHPALTPAGSALPGTAERFAGHLWRLGATRVSLGEAPAAPMPALGANQMRYTWARARAYAEWVRGHPAEGDFLVFQEVLRGADGVVRGMMLYVIEGSGQIAFVSLWNSHHWPQGEGPAQVEAACDLMAERFQRALTWDAQRLFPPYGVG